MEITDTLFIIPARGGSKGLPRKNILPLNGKPLIYFTIDAVRGVTSDENICVSTDDLEITKLVEDYGLKVPFKRPQELASDFASSLEVILHAINYYKNNLDKTYPKVCLLQPTSPFRTAIHIEQAYVLMKDDIDMVVSVKSTKSNPYFNLFEEDEKGLLKKSKSGNYTIRQDCPLVWEYNGAIYFYNVNRINLKDKNIQKYVMEEKDSIDIDNETDWLLANLLISK
jgi:N-acylneuraminate cytidylyltransferase